MTALWADFSGGRPGASALKSAGFTGVIRYVGLGSAGKRITAAEYADYVANGIQVLLVAELGTTDALGGQSAGVANAQAAQADARSLGIPDTVGIAAASDMHLTPSQVTAAVAYMRGFASVLGPRAGAYGFAEYVDAVHADGLGTWWWKCGSAPTSAEGWVTFWQRNSGQTTATVNGVVCDINEQRSALSSAVLAGGNDMAVTDPLPVKRPDGSVPTVGDALGNLYIGTFYGGTSGPSIYTQLATIVANTAAVAASQANSNITADELTTIVNQAVVNNLKITGTVEVSGGTS